MCMCVFGCVSASKLCFMASRRTRPVSHNIVNTCSTTHIVSPIITIENQSSIYTRCIDLVM